MDEQFEQAREIDQICDAFEEVWKTDGPSQLEPFLESGLSSCPRGELLTALLLIELELHNRIGPLPSLEDTLHRFPDDRETVIRAYRNAQAFAADKSMPQQLGPYEIRDEVGRGTFGTVYRAFDRRLKRIVALKVLHPWFAASRQFVDRFEREAQAASDLNHPNICLVLDIGFAEGRHYYAMQYSEGPSLAQHIADHGRLASGEAVEMVRQLSKALAIAHEREIVHRDLKPANVLLQKDGKPQLADFGLAQGNGEQHDVIQIAGTPAYMAPEQLYGNLKEATVTTDIYSLGAICFEMLTGLSPVSIPAGGQAREHYVESMLRQHASPRITTAIKKALSIDASKRHSSANDFASDLSSPRSVTDKHNAIRTVVALTTAVIFIGLLVNSFRNDHRTGRHTLTTGKPSNFRETPFVKSQLYETNWQGVASPLKEWLNGREVLTVSQDGTAMFSTITAALAALRPGQVVKVMDRGPYREGFVFDTPPRDCGLVSEVGTHLEITEWEKRAGYDPEKPFFVGCEVNNTAGFRISGFDVSAPGTPQEFSHTACILYVRTANTNSTVLPLIVDGCRFRWSDEEDWSLRKPEKRAKRAKALIVVAAKNSSPVFVRRCYLEGHLDLDTYVPAVITENLILAKHTTRAISVTPGVGQHIVVQDNLLIAETGFQINFRHAHKFGFQGVFPNPHYQFRNNYFEGTVGIDVPPPREGAEAIEVPQLVINHNIFNCPVSVFFATERDAEVANTNWTHRHNYFFGARPTDSSHSLMPTNTDRWDSSGPLKSPGDPLDTSTMRRAIKSANSGGQSKDTIGPRLEDGTTDNDWLYELEELAEGEELQD